MGVVSPGNNAGDGSRCTCDDKLAGSGLDGTLARSRARMREAGMLANWNTEMDVSSGCVGDGGNQGAGGPCLGVG